MGRQLSCFISPLPNPLPKGEGVDGAAIPGLRIFSQGLVAILLVTATTVLHAQALTLPLKRPSQQLPELPEFQPDEPVQPLQLPELPVPSPEQDLSGQLKVFVKAIQLEGNSVFTDEELAEVTAEYENREITTGKLQELRYALTLHYVNRGYINSGAIIPDQTVTDGLVTIRIIEGKLTDIEVSGNERLKSNYISGRASLGSGPPLNIVKLGEQLQILQQNPRLKRVNATLEPGSRRGESRLRIDVEEAQAYGLRVAVDNHQPPSVGGEQGRISGFHRNLTGHGDTAEFEFDKADGLDDLYVNYALPVNRHDTTVGAWYSRIDSEVVEDPFDVLDIEGEQRTVSLYINQPFHLSVSRLFRLGLSLDVRENITYLLGERFSFSPAAENGEIKLSVLRFSQEWQDRGRDRVIAARSMFSAGLNAFDATVNGEAGDGSFVSWLGQFQWAQRIANTNSQFIFRSYAQLADSGLPAMEKFTIGGANTVRGYRENRLLGDSGLVVSLEGRIPLYTSSGGDVELQLAPFIDYGQVSNRKVDNPHPDNIASAGLGIRGRLFKRVELEVYYGYPFRDFDDPNNDLQDDGLSFSLAVNLL